MECTSHAAPFYDLDAILIAQFNAAGIHDCGLMISAGVLAIGAVFLAITGVAYVIALFRLYMK